MGIRIITDSASDIEREVAKKWNVEIIPLKTLFGNEEYLDGVNLSHEEFFEKLIESDTLPTTSQITPYEYEEVFEDVKEKNDTAICITISSKLSGCYQSAYIASRNFEDCVTVIDSENVCAGEYILVELAVRLRDEGKSAKEIAEIIEQEKKKVRLIALLDTLEYLKKGGRISPTVAFAGTLLGIKPVIAIEGGEVVMVGKARGSKNGNNMLMQLVEKKGGIDFDKPYCLAYSGISSVLLDKYVADSVSLYEDKVTEFPIISIGSTIGTHVGPGAIATAFFSYK